MFSPHCFARTLTDDSGEAAFLVSRVTVIVFVIVRTEQRLIRDCLGFASFARCENGLFRGWLTDPFGHAALKNLPPDDKYFLIGIDKDPDTNVVTIWSKAVEVNPGENLVELSPNDVIYQD